ncbi:MAG: tetratricopeptide repeat protein [Pseudomonadota bacterium]
MKKHRPKQSRLPLAALLAALLFLGACSRLIILDDPLSPEEHLQLGLSYEQSGQYDLAEQEYKRVAGKLPLAHLYWGNLLYGQKQYQQAEEHYLKAIRGLPDNPEPYNNLAWLYYEQGLDLDEAERLARRALDLAPAERKAPFQDTLDHIIRAKAGK